MMVGRNDGNLSESVIAGQYFPAIDLVLWSDDFGTVGGA